MVERAMLAGTAIFLGMGFARTVQQLMALRVLQGFLTGSITAATALALGRKKRFYRAQPVSSRSASRFAHRNASKGISSVLMRFRIPFMSTAEPRLPLMRS
jgi:hypothetical protein